MQGVVVLVVLLGIAYAAGYFTRDYISRKRREHSRRWRNYVEPEWLRASPAANTNEVTAVNEMTPPAPANGELGQMLGRWENRARARRTG